MVLTGLSSRAHAPLIGAFIASAIVTLGPARAEPLPRLHTAAAADAPTATNHPRFEFLSIHRALARVESKQTTTIDARSLTKYLAAHVPGAVSVRDEQVREASGSHPAKILDGAALGTLFGRLGISPDEPVLVYADGEDPLSATLIAYALMKAGHQRVSVLDGGFTAWQGAGPTTQDYPAITPVEWRAAPAPTESTLDDVRVALAREESALVDARPARLYRGESRAWKRNGHIPGAVSLDWHQLVQPDNESLLRPADEIAKLLDKSGLDPSHNTIVYCGTGREATLLYLYLSGVAAWPNVRLFEGSWTEYQSHDDLPVAIGSDARPRVVSDGEMSLSGQPTPDQFRELAERGVRLVINCRAGSETRKLDFREKAIVESLGMKYAEIPLGGGDGYSTADVEALGALLDANGGTSGVLMHCAGGGRSATLWAAYLVKQRGLTPAAAMERVRATGVLRETSLERLLGAKLELKEIGG